MEKSSVQVNAYSIIKEQLSSSTAHAIPNIFRTKSLTIKLFWTSVFIFASALCSFMIFQSVNDFLQFEVNTKTRFFREFPVVFPAVVICNKDPFATESSKEILANIIRNKYKYSNENDLELINEFITYAEDNDLIDLKYLALYESIFEDKYDIGYNYSEFIIDCKFYSIDCQEDDFEQFIDKENGLCYKFNHKPPFKNLTKIGNSNGLELSLLVGKPKEYLSLIKSSGAIIYIYNQSSSHSEADRIELSPGTSTSIVLSKSFISAQPFPYSDCILSPENNLNSNIRDQLSKKNLSYHIRYCFETCLQLKILNKCSCISYDLEDALDEEPTCVNSTQDICEASIILNKTIQESCLNQCPRECLSQKYNYKIFSSFYPSESAKSRIENNSNHEIIEKLISNELKFENVVLNLIIYIDDYYQEIISESPAMSFAGLLSNIGGTLGLFLGVSVLSFFEIFEIIIEILFYLYEKRNKVNQNQIALMDQENTFNLQ